MLKQTFDPALPYKYIMYGRMSDESQNPRSPDQQFTTVHDSLRRLGYNWQPLGSYRDNGISGRVFQKRTGYQQMISDIKSRVVQPDVVLVDTIERLARSEELPEIRRNLHQKYGVLVLTADSGFVDPTSVSGRALGFVEALRATEENRVKAHNVLRGKRDAVLQGKWAGGTAPYGYQLKSVFKDVNGRQEVDYSVLTPDPKTSWIIQLLFQKAIETGWGSSRLAKFLNDHPDIAADLKPIAGSNVGFWVKQKIYKGTYEWEVTNTGVVGDRRVSQLNPEVDRVVHEDFCTPLVTTVDWERVQELRRQRSAIKRSPRQRGGGDKLLPAVARGLVLKYPLTGLVRCGHCDRAMTPASSAIYVTKDGEERRYVGYACPVVNSGICDNKTRVPEEWLREAVISSLLRHFQLIPRSPESRNDQNAMLGELTLLVERELTRIVDERPSRAVDLQEEVTMVERQIEGWSQSLGRPDLPSPVRRDLELKWATASDRLEQIQMLLAEELMRGQQRRLNVDIDQVTAGLQQLHEVIAGKNATLANFHLALHIDTIACNAGGQVVLRVCKLGVLPQVHELVKRFVSGIAVPAPALKHCRRRGTLAVDTPGNPLHDDASAEYFALSPDRFHGLPEEFFWEETFTIPVRKSWVELHAEEVYQRRQLPGMTFPKLAAAFDKSIPTVRKALKIAQQRQQA